MIDLPQTLSSTFSFNLVTIKHSFSPIHVLDRVPPKSLENDNKTRQVLTFRGFVPYGAYQVNKRDDLP